MPSTKIEATAGDDQAGGGNVAELEAQAVELEQKARDLRSRISAMKTGARSAESAPAEGLTLDRRQQLEWQKKISAPLDAPPGGFPDARPDPDDAGDGPRVRGFGPVAGDFAWCGRRHATGPTWIDAGWALGVGAGFYSGCWLLGPTAVAAGQGYGPPELLSRRPWTACS